MHPLRTILVTTIFAASVPLAAAASVRLPSAPIRLPGSGSSSVAYSSAGTAPAAPASPRTSSSKMAKGSVVEYCASISAALAKAAKVVADEQTMKKVDQTVDFLTKAEAICASMNLGSASSASSPQSSKCAPDGFMGVKGKCDDKSWSTGGVCMSKGFWEQQVKQSCTGTMQGVAFEQPCVTKGNACAANASSATSSTSSACMVEGFKGASILCSGKPFSSGGVCKSKAYWDAWAKQTCSNFTAFEAKVPCSVACAK